MSPEPEIQILNPAAAPTMVPHTTGGGSTNVIKHFQIPGAITMPKVREQNRCYATQLFDLSLQRKPRKNLIDKKAFFSSFVFLFSLFFFAKY